MKETLLEVAHEIAKDLYVAGALDAKTMKEFDANCLPAVRNYTPSQIKSIRLRNKVSQSVFAAYFNTTPSTIRQWEQGLKKPGGISTKVLSLVDRHGIDYIAA